MDIFGDLFDLNHDGKLDAFEKAAEMSFFQMIMNEEEQEEEDSDGNSRDSK